MKHSWKDFFYFDYVEASAVGTGQTTLNKLPTVNGDYIGTYIAYNKETCGFIIVKDLQFTISKSGTTIPQ